MAPRTRRPQALLLTLLFVLAACGDGAAQDPKDALTSALRRMRGDGGTIVDLTLATDDASIQALQADGGEALPAEAVQLIRTGSLRVSMPLSPDATTGAFAFRVGDEALIEVRTIDKAHYARANVPRLLEAFGQDPAMADGFRQMLASGGMLPADAIDGRWIKLTGAEQAMQALTGMGAQDAAGDPATPPGFDQAKLQAASARLAGMLADASTVQRVGKDSDGDHLRASVPLREAYAAIMAEVAGLGFPIAEEQRTAIEDVPDEDVVFDVWIAGGRVGAAEFDFLQIAELDPEADIPAGVTRLALRAAFTPFDGVVEVPADAVEIDIAALMQGMFMGMGMGAEGGGGFEYDPSDPSSMPPGFDPSLVPGYDPSLPGHQPTEEPVG